MQTPEESLQKRLQVNEPQIKAELDMLTETYTLVRYAGNLPQASEIDQAKKVWNKLDRKWNQDHNPHK